MPVAATPRGFLEAWAGRPDGASLGAWAKAREKNRLPAPGVGIGVDAGTVTCGAIGDEARLEFAVIGDPVNRAAKLQNHTKVEQVQALATLEALERAVRQGYAGEAAEVRRARRVAGVGEPLDLAVLG